MPQGVKLDAQTHDGPTSSSIPVERVPTIHGIYTRLVEALSMSVIRLLSKEYCWLPIGRYCCIGAPALTLSNGEEKFCCVNGQDTLGQASFSPNDKPPFLC